MNIFGLSQSRRDGSPVATNVRGERLDHVEGRGGAPIDSRTARRLVTQLERITPRPKGGVTKTHRLPVRLLVVMLFLLLAALQVEASGETSVAPPAVGDCALFGQTRPAWSDLDGGHSLGGRGVEERDVWKAPPGRVAGDSTAASSRRLPENSTTHGARSGTCQMGCMGVWHAEI